MAQTGLMGSKVQKRKKMQHVVQSEEGIQLSIDETLFKILRSYSAFVPYN